MSLNVKSSVEVNTKTAEASLDRVVAKFGKFAKVTEHTKNKIDILAHSFQATSLAYQGLQKISSVAGDFIKTADAINTMNARLKLTTTSTAHFEALKKSIEGIAKSTYSSTDSISNLFIGLNSNLKALCASQQEILDYTQTITQTFRVNGAEAEETSRALIQLNQAFSTGVLRGES